MAPAVLRAVAQAKVTQTSATQAPAKPTGLKALPKQAGRFAALLLANAGTASVALAEQGLSLPDVALPTIDTGAASDIAALFSDNPLLVGGGAAIIAIPLAVSAFIKSADSAGAVKPTSVERTLQALQEDPRVKLVDIRSKAETKEQGSPDLRSIKKSATVLPYTSVVKGELVVDEAFAEKFSEIRGLDEESLVVFLDSDGSIAKQAAAEVADTVAKVYFVQGGAEAWSEVGPWKAPSSGLSLSLPSFNLKAVGSSVNELAEDFKKAPTITKAGLATGAIIGAGVLIFNEIEVVLELAGLFAAGNFLLKLVFAEEREKTLTDIKTLVDEKVAIQDLGSDLNKIAKAVVEDVPAENGAAAPAAAVKAAEPAAAPAADNAKEAKEWIENWKEKTNA